MKIYLTLPVALLFSHFLLAQAPVINSFSPASGPVGSAVTINGTNFNASATGNVVFFGAVKATVATASPVSLTVTVPPGATYQPITVTTGGRTAFSSKPFIVTFPGAGTGFFASSFIPKIDYTTGKGPSCVATGDFDGDGKPDLAAVNDTTNTVSIFRNLSTNGTINLAPKIDFITGNQPYCIVSGDIDGDGKQDITIANGVSNTISVLRNTSSGPGNISFAPKVDLSSGSFPFCVIVRDFDGDGKSDLASANSKSNSVSIFKNNSTPGVVSFAAKVDFTTGISPVWLDAGDLDNDGRPDIATANSTNTGSVSMFRNTSTPGSISFAAKTDFDGGTYAYSIMMGDIDGDGKLDLTVAGESGATLNILLNRTTGIGNILFDQRATLTVGNSSYGVTLSDLDGNAKPDIIVSNTNTNTVSVFRNKSFAGFLSFDQNKDFLVGNGPWVSVAVDLDGDSKPDIATANQRSGNISVLKNVVSSLAIQSFTPAAAGTGVLVAITGSGFTGITGVSFGGTPADSFSVISPAEISARVGAGSSGNLTITTNTTNAFLSGFTFLPSPTITSVSPQVAGTGDTVLINGTNFTGTSAISFGGVAALSFTIVSSTQIKAVVGEGGSGNVTVTAPGGVVSSGGFTYIPAPVVASFTPSNAAPGSVVTITGNYFTGATMVKFGEIAATSFTVISPTSITAVASSIVGGTVSVTTPFGTGKRGGFYNGHTVTSFTPASGPVGTVVTINGSNFDVNPSHNTVFFGAVKAIVTQASATTLTAVVPYGTNYQLISVATNGVLAYSTTPFIQTFTNGDTVLNEYSFAPGIKVPTGINPYHIAVGDLDGDGKADIAVADGVLGMFRNTSTKGAISFTRTDLNWAGAGHVSISDLDGDGKPEVIASNNADVVGVFKNNSIPGQLSFSAALSFTFGGNSYYRLAIGDVDGDGKPDIAVTQITSNKVLIFRNTTANGIISFSSVTDYPTGTEPQAAVFADIDGDRKPDLLVSNINSNKISVYKNISSPGIILFDFPHDVVAPYALATIATGDFDGDGQLDIAASNITDSSVMVFRNQSMPGMIAFEEPKRLLVGVNPYDLFVNDVDGDGRPDIAAVDIILNKLTVLKNKSSNGAILFAAKSDYDANASPTAVSIVDFDGDGKADIAVANFQYNALYVYRNRMGEGLPVVLCPPVANTILTSDLTGANYQWQLNTGSGFNNISNNSNYAGSNTATLALTAIPSSWYGYRYRCIADGKAGDVFEIKFADSWSGAVNTAWENAGNWTCGKVPDSNTDVVINSGTIVINSNVTIGSLVVNPGATVTVSAGYKLTILR